MTRPRSTGTSPPGRSTARGTAGSRRRPGGRQWRSLADRCALDWRPDPPRFVNLPDARRPLLGYERETVAMSAHECTQRSPCSARGWRSPSRQRLARISADLACQTVGGPTAKRDGRTATPRADYWLGPSGWSVLVAQHVTAGSAAAWSRLRRHGGIVPPARRSQGARRLATWQLSFQGAMLVVAANTPACLRVTLARRWR